jgi:hypothetical protein
MRLVDRRVNGPAAVGAVEDEYPQLAFQLRDHIP